MILFLIRLRKTSCCVLTHVKRVVPTIWWRLIVLKYGWAVWCFVFYFDLHDEWFLVRINDFHLKFWEVTLRYRFLCINCLTTNNHLLFPTIHMITQTVIWFLWSKWRATNFTAKTMENFSRCRKTCDSESTRRDECLRVACSLFEDLRETELDVGRFEERQTVA